MPIANLTLVSTPVVNTAFVDDYSMLGLGMIESGYNPLFPHMLLLPLRFSGMNNYMGWDTRMGMRSYDGGMYYRSTMLPVLNMPPSSPTAVEKWECEEGRGGKTSPAQKRWRKENTADHCDEGVAHYVQ